MSLWSRPAGCALWGWETPAVEFGRLCLAHHDSSLWLSGSRHCMQTHDQPTQLPYRHMHSTCSCDHTFVPAAIRSHTVKHTWFIPVLTSPATVWFFFRAWAEWAVFVYERVCILARVQLCICACVLGRGVYAPWGGRLREVGPGYRFTSRCLHRPERGQLPLPSRGQGRLQQDTQGRWTSNGTQVSSHQHQRYYTFTRALPTHRTP